MKSKNIKKNTLIICFIIIVSILLFNTLILNNIKKEREEIYSKSIINNIRIKVKPSLDTAKNFIMDKSYKNKLTKELKHDNLKMAIISTDSTIIYKSQNLNDEINSLDESMYMDNSFLASDKHFYKIAFPIVISNNLKGTAIFYLNSKDVYVNRNLYLNRIIFLIILEIIFLIFMILVVYGLIKKKVLTPLNVLQKAAHRINTGDFDFEIPHSENEVGQFAASFELMRDEIYENIKTRNRAEKSNKELIAAISHDIRTPVATISAYIEAIKSGVAKDEERLNKYLNIIYSKSLELKKLTEDLFIHSEINANKLIINKKEIYFKDFIKKMLEPVYLETNNLGINFKLKTDIPDIIVNIDERRICEVFLNIIENSKKYIKENGKIELYLKLKNDRIEVKIKDNGIGIKAEDMPYIFDKFYRGEKSRNKAYGGAGLGLSICKNIIEAHGGEIHIDSLDEVETTVSFTIPVDNF
ncbi:MULTISPECIES: sensor histidine kinase [Clostridium]|uniref:sensor histidine kinase n=1 Tax=Clostridium TaxID=1485 RepID=UPI0008242091|nr:MULTISPECIES: HAMP domain-containing sensor histidine kinase [Clostridium]